MSGRRVRRAAAAAALGLGGVLGALAIAYGEDFPGWSIPLLAAAALPVVIGWVRTTGGPRAFRSKPWAYAALRAVDDLSYGAGVWAGALEERRPGAILPRRPVKVRARSRRRRPPTGARR